jgi:hypothetical protein
MSWTKYLAAYRLTSSKIHYDLMLVPDPSFQAQRHHAGNYG